MGLTLRDEPRALAETVMNKRDLYTDYADELAWVAHVGSGDGLGG